MISAEQLQGIEAMGKVLAGALPYVKRAGETPASIAGRFLGLGQEQSISSVPKWAWFGVGAVAGVSVALMVVPAIQRRMGR